MQPVAEAPRMEVAAHKHFGLRILAFNAAHVVAARHLIVHICHDGFKKQNRACSLAGCRKTILQQDFFRSISKTYSIFTTQTNLMHARLHQLLLIFLCMLPGGAFAKAPAPAADFCATLQQAMKAADGGPDGLKSLATEAAETGKYFRDYSHNGSVMNASLQIGGALQTNVAKSGSSHYMHIIMEDLGPDSDVKAKYAEWRAAVSACIKSAGRPLKGYQGGEVNYYYESGNAVVKVQYSEKWAGTNRSLITIDIENTDVVFHSYRSAAGEAQRPDIDATGGSTTTGGSGSRGGAGKAQPAKEETHLFLATCRNVQTLCKVYANMNKHPFSEVEAKATSQLSGKSCGAMRYLGKEGDVKMPGTPGRDYVVTEAVIMDF